MFIPHPSKNFHPENACASEIFLDDNPHRSQPPSFGAACATITADPRHRRQVERLHEQGVRPIAELLAEIAAAHGLEADISKRLARFAAIPEDALDVTDGRCFPPDPMYEVSR